VNAASIRGMVASMVAAATSAAKLSSRLDTACATRSVAAGPSAISTSRRARCRARSALYSARPEPTVASGSSDFRMPVSGSTPNTSAAMPRMNGHSELPPVSTTLLNRSPSGPPAPSRCIVRRIHSSRSIGWPVASGAGKPKRWK
jgi:hypothetical protein